MTSEINSYIKKNSDIEFSINIFDLNKITKVAYGVSIEMVLVDKNTSVYFNVEKITSEENNELIVDAITNESLEKDKYGVILNDLCAKGEIPKGKYKIEAFW